MTFQQNYNRRETDLETFSRRTWFSKLIFNAFIESSPHLHRFQSKLFCIVPYKPYHMDHMIWFIWCGPYGWSIWITDIGFIIFPIWIACFSKISAVNFYWKQIDSSLTSVHPSQSKPSVEFMLTEFNFCDLIFVVFQI